MNDKAAALAVQLCKKGPFSKASLSGIHYSLSEGGLSADGSWRNH
jgi:hypothetical protein